MVMLLSSSMSAYSLVVLFALLLVCQGHRDRDAITYPRNRYLPWELLDSDEKAAAFQLGYLEATWNNPGTARIAQYSYDYIAENFPEQHVGIEELGWNSHIWDCYMVSFCAPRICFDLESLLYDLSPHPLMLNA